LPAKLGKQIEHNTVFEVLVVLFPRVHVWWGVMLCHWVSSTQCFEGTVILQNVGKNSPTDSVTTLKTRIANLKVFKRRFWYSDSCKYTAQLNNWRSFICFAASGARSAFAETKARVNAVRMWHKITRTAGRHQGAESNIRWTRDSPQTDWARESDSHFRADGAEPAAYK